MKKTISVFLILCFSFALLVGCNNQKNEIDELKKQVEELKNSSTSISENNIETTLPTQIPLSNIERGALNAVKLLKNNLKDPSSLQIHGICYWSFTWEEDKISTRASLEIDYSAKNGLGGVNRDIYYVNVDKKSFIASVNQIGWSHNENLTDELSKESINRILDGAN